MAMSFIIDLQRRVWEAFPEGRCLGPVLLDDITVAFRSELPVDGEFTRVEFGIASTDGLLPVDGFSIVDTVLSFLSMYELMEVDVGDMKHAMRDACAALQCDPCRNPLSTYASLRAELAAWLSRCSIMRDHCVQPSDWRALRQFIDEDATHTGGAYVQCLPAWESVDGSPRPIS
jgi:hypothetical protein